VIEGADVSSVEHQILDLTATAIRAAKERADCEASLAVLQRTLERAQAELPEAELLAKRKRQEAHDAVRGRADLERRISDLLEVEEVARTRSHQAMQRAASFKAAMTFAAAARAEAERGGDVARFEREGGVAERAQREFAAAEVRAAEEREAEAKVATERANLETHAAAEREIEAVIASERQAAERRCADLVSIIARVKDDIAAARENVKRFQIDFDRLSSRRDAAEGQLQEVRRRARSEIETRVAQLLATEESARRERLEQEGLLAALDESETRAENERSAAESAERGHLGLKAAPAGDALGPALGTRAMPPAPSPVSAGMAPSNDLPFAAATPALSEPLAPFADEGIAEQPPRPLFGWFGRRQTAAPVESVEDLGPSIADRIARDFGLLGSKDPATELG